jgi:hypothetical protein
MRRINFSAGIFIMKINLPILINSLNENILSELELKFQSDKLNNYDVG